MAVDDDFYTKLKEYSLGIVVKKKPYGDDIAEVWPVEHFSMEHGEVKEDTREMTLEVENLIGVPIPVDVKGSAILKAKWIPRGNSNRDTSPDVNVNETVMIYRYAHTDKFYWDTIFREPKLRRLEHVRYAYSNKPDGLDEFDPESSYWIEYSTAEKRIRLHTSDNDGEACKYDITLKTDQGYLEIKDSLGNLIKLNSTAAVLTTETNSAVYFKTPLFHVDAGKIVLNGVTYTKTHISEGPCKAAGHPVPGEPCPEYGGES